jgi:carotenoid cleavage dioxygenase-like enzyme
MTAPVTTSPGAAALPLAPRHGYPDTAAFRGFFAPSRIEADLFDLDVDGEIPSELYGAFYRAAADTQFPPRYDNDIYINGDGMITMIRFERGHADLRTRYVRTQRFQLERAARRAAPAPAPRRAACEPPGPAA